MMTYTFEVVEKDANSTINQWPGEPEAEFLARMAAAKGKNFFSINITCFRNGSAQRKHCESPYFRNDTPAMREGIFKKLMEKTATEILEREKDLPPDEGPAEEPLIVLPPHIGR